MHLLLFDALGDRYGGDLPGVDYKIGPGASDEELVQALTGIGASLLVSIVTMPPVDGKGRAEARLLRGALTGDVTRAIAASRFLAHALVEHAIADAEFTTEFADRLDYETAPPRAIELRSLHALRTHAPIGEADTEVLRDAKAHMFEGKDVFHTDESFQVQGAIGFRSADYQRSAATRAIATLLGSAYDESQTASDNRGYSNLIGSVKTIHMWRPAESQMFETMAAVESG